MFTIPIGRIPLFEVDNPHKMTKAKKELEKRFQKCREGLRVKNCDLTKVAKGHLSYRSQLVSIIDAIEFNA